jgi:hypothetical protein
MGSSGGMPTENTHLYFADKILKKNEICHPAVKRHIKCFYLGSICPDAFYWTNREPVKNVFLFIHKSSGLPLKNLIFDWLDILKQNRSEKELVFLFGFLTHCALDIAFHPGINAIAGDIFDENPEKCKQACYVHAYVECYIDKKFNHTSFFKRLQLDDIKLLAGIEFFARRFGIPKGEIYRSYRRQKAINLMYRSKVAYHMIYFLQKFNLCSLYALPYFDENLKQDRRNINHIMAYKHPATGQRVEKTVGDLFADAHRLAADLIGCADAYYHDRVSRKQGETIIDGSNLVTGKV